MRITHHHHLDDIMQQQSTDLPWESVTLEEQQDVVWFQCSGPKLICSQYQQFSQTRLPLNLDAEDMQDIVQTF